MELNNSSPRGLAETTSSNRSEHTGQSTRSGGEDARSAGEGRGGPELVPAMDGGPELVTAIDGGPELVTATDGGPELVPVVNEDPEPVPSVNAYPALVPENYGGSELVPRKDGGQELIPMNDGGPKPVSGNDGGSKLLPGPRSSPIMTSVFSEESMRTEKVSKTVGGEAERSRDIISEKAVSICDKGADGNQQANESFRPAAVNEKAGSTAELSSCHITSEKTDNTGKCHGNNGYTKQDSALPIETVDSVMEYPCNIGEVAMATLYSPSAQLDEEEDSVMDTNGERSGLNCASVAVMEPESTQSFVLQLSQLSPANTQSQHWTPQAICNPLLPGPANVDQGPAWNGMGSTDGEHNEVSHSGHGDSCTSARRSPGRSHDPNGGSPGRSHDDGGGSPGRSHDPSATALCANEHNLIQLAPVYESLCQDECGSEMVQSDLSNHLWQRRICYPLAVNAFQREGSQEKAGGSQEKAGGSQEKAGGSQEKAGGSQEKAGGSQEKAGGSQEKAGGSQEKAGGSQEKAGGSQEKAGGSQEKAGGSEEKAGGSEEKAGGSQEKAGGSEEKAGGSQEKAGGSQEKAGGSQEKEVGSQDKEVGSQGIAEGSRHMAAVCSQDTVRVHEENSQADGSG